MAEEELAEAIELEDETEEVPDNFVDQMASRIGIILQREMDPTVGATEVTKYIYETTYPNKVNYFIDAMEMLHESHTTDKYAALTWSGMISAAAHNKDYDTFMHAMLDKMIQGYYGMEKSGRGPSPPSQQVPSSPPAATAQRAPGRASA